MMAKKKAKTRLWRWMRALKEVRTNLWIWTRKVKLRLKILKLSSLRTLRPKTTSKSTVTRNSHPRLMAKKSMAKMAKRPQLARLKSKKRKPA